MVNFVARMLRRSRVGARRRASKVAPHRSAGRENRRRYDVFHRLLQRRADCEPVVGDDPVADARGYRSACEHAGCGVHDHGHFGLLLDPAVTAADQAGDLAEPGRRSRRLRSRRSPSARPSCWLSALRSSQALDPEDIAVLTTTQLRGVTAADITALGSTQLAVFSATQMSALAVTQLRGFNPAGHGRAYRNAGARVPCDADRGSRNDTARWPASDGAWLADLAAGILSDTGRRAQFDRDPRTIDDSRGSADHHADCGAQRRAGWRIRRDGDHAILDDRNRLHDVNTVGGPHSGSAASVERDADRSVHADADQRISPPLADRQPDIDRA